MREEKNLRTLRIDKDLHIKMKKMCNNRGIKLYSWVENILRKQLKYEEINNK